MKPGRPRGLTIEQVCAAVIEDGVATFSMPSIARHLGVAHSGLYRYVRNREELLVLVLDKLAREAIWPDPGQPWRDQLTGIGETVWSICQTYPGYATAALGTEHVSTGFVESVEPNVNSLRNQGLDMVDAASAVESPRWSSPLRLPLIGWLGPISATARSQSTRSLAMTSRTCGPAAPGTSDTSRSIWPVSPAASASPRCDCT